MKTATLTIDGKEYTFGTIMIGPGEDLDKAPQAEAALTFVSLSLQAGGHTEATPEWIRANLPRFHEEQPTILALMNKAYEANGFKTKAKILQGENRPAGPASLDSASTSTTSLEALPTGAVTQ